MVNYPFHFSFQIKKRALCHFLLWVHFSLNTCIYVKGVVYTVACWSFSSFNLVGNICDLYYPK